MSSLLFRTCRSPQIRTLICSTLIVTMLASCAAQRTFDDGKEQVNQGNVEGGLKKMQDASKLDPKDVQFKTTYYQTRDTAIANYLVQGDHDVTVGNYQEADELYRRVQGIDAGNIRAADGLKQIELEKSHASLLEEASQAVQNANYPLASQKLNIVMTEDPGNARALELKRTIAAKTSKAAVSDALAAIYKKPITLQFKDASLKQIFEIIAQSSGLNFIFDKDVKTDQRTSIFLKNSTIEAAVYFTLLTNQLDQQVMDGNTILVYPKTSAKQKDYQEMVVKSFYMTNADAKVVAATLKSIIKVHDVVVDDKLNMLIIRDTPEAVKLAEKLVALHDIAEPEVMLDVAVLEVKRTKLQDLGVQWPNGLTLTPIAPTNALTTTNIPAGALTLNQLLHIPESIVSVGNPSAQVNAHSTDTDANLLANPRIRTRNHEKAKIMIGDRVPNITVNTAPSATTFVSETINYVDVGLKLEVEPTVYLDNEVAIKISLEVSNIVSQLITKSGSAAYQIGTRNASSVLRLKDGETQVLAGLLDDEERHTINKIPALGDIPILGHLFGSTNDDLQKTEIILSITPHLVRNIRRPEADVAEFNSGTENNLKPRPDIGGSIAIAPTGGGVSGVPGPLNRPAAPVRAVKNNLSQPARFADNPDGDTPTPAAVEPTSPPDTTVAPVPAPTPNPTPNPTSAPAPNSGDQSGASQGTPFDPKDQ